MARKNECVFCTIDSEKWVLENDLSYGLYDLYPVNRGHLLIIPKRHVASYFELENDEIAAMHDLLQQGKNILEKELQPDGWNVGVNVNHWGGQTIFHVHMHLIPRFSGDVIDPRGGVRNIKSPLVPYPAETGSVMRFEKLVRDKIPEIIAASGKEAICRRDMDLDSVRRRLLNKLQEEAEEFRITPCVEELADLVEVVDGLAHREGFSFAEVLAIKEKKRAERGGFDLGIILDTVK